MNQFPASIQLKLIPAEPDTISSVKSELIGRLERELAERDRAQLLSSGDVRFELRRTFPTDEAIILAITLASQVAFETYKEIILPMLKNWLNVEEDHK